MTVAATPVRLALSGFGKWGQQLYRSLQGSGIAEFAAVVSSQPDRVAAVAPDVKTYGTLGHALADPAIDGVVLAIPHSLHAEQVIAAARAGKGVFVEKPFALTLAEADRALEAVAEAGVALGLGHNRRFLPAMQRLKQMVEGGQLGTIMHAEATYTGGKARSYTPGHWRLSEAESPAGGLAGSGIHIIDALIHLIGPIRRVQASSIRRAVEGPMDDTTAVLFLLAAGPSAVLTNIVATVPEFRLRIFGSALAVELAGHDRLILTDTDGNRTEEKFPVPDTLRLELETFALAIAGGAPFPITPDQIRNGVATFEAICHAAATGQPVEINPSLWQ